MDFLQKATPAEVAEIIAIGKSLLPDWYDIRDLCAFIQIESSFQKDAYRFEPALNEASYGLTQLLMSTARQLDYAGTGVGLYEPILNINLHIQYREWIFHYLSDPKHLNRSPTLEEQVSAYNEGVGNVTKGRKDPGYFAKWQAARDYWAKRIDASATGGNLAVIV